MMTVRPSGERGHVQFGWLDTHHTFSFGNYYDPNHIHFRHLRVINEDWIQPDSGFGTHPHRDMEILTYVLSGSLKHRDSLGHQAIISPGEVQRITAGTGIAHSEFNPSDTEPVHLLQIWILPWDRGLTPSYDQRHFSAEDRQGRWQLIASGNPETEAIHIQQDVDLYAAQVAAGDQLTFSLNPDRHAWIQVAQGKLTLNGVSIEAGDGVAISEESHLDLQAHADAEVLLFDLV